MLMAAESSAQKKLFVIIALVIGIYADRSIRSKGIGLSQIQ